jgi:acyl-CoA hydrolase
MDNYILVRPEHLNHYGYLFGGNLLKWVDEFSWLCASRDYPGCSLVTIGLDKVVFKEQIKNGSILRFNISKLTSGTTSVTYETFVYASEPGSSKENQVFSTHITFVCIDTNGNKTPLPDMTKY